MKFACVFHAGILAIQKKILKINSQLAQELA
jgi:hypothetical protein